jgi:glycosyltransferase involved in cell wall biosynthesis
MKHICYIISDIHKSVYFEQTAIHLRAHEFQLSFILINCKGGALEIFLRNEKFIVHTMEVEKLSKSIPAIRSCKQLLKTIQPELIHCHLADANWVGLWAGKWAGIKHRIYTRHSGAPLNQHWKETIIDRIQNKLATRIISISQNIDELLASQGVTVKKRKRIHHGFDLNRFHYFDQQEVERIQQSYNPERQFPVIGVIARWMKWKGIQDTIAAFHQILIEYPDALLCLFGASDNADYSVEINRLLNEIPPKNIRVVGFEQNVFDLYQLFDVYVHVPVNPSCEAFGQTYVEALAAGIPSVFTLSGVAREFVENRIHALVVPFENPKAIAASITEILHNKPLCEQLIKNGRDAVKNQFEFRHYIQNLVSLYHEANS